MTPRDAAVYPQASLDDAALAELDAELAKTPYPAQPAATLARAPGDAPKA